MELSPELTLAIEAALKGGDIILDIYEREHIEVELKDDASPVTEADREASRAISKILRLSGAYVVCEEGIEHPYAERRTWNSLWMVDPLDGTREFLKHNGEFTINIALLDYDTPVLGVIYAPARNEMYFCSQLSGAWYVGNVKEALCSREGLFRDAKRLPLQGEERPFRVVASRAHLDEKTARYIASLRREHPDLEIVQVGSALKLAMVASGEADLYVRYGTTMEWDTAAGHALLSSVGKELVTMDLGVDLHYNKEDLRNPSFVARGGALRAVTRDA